METGFRFDYENKNFRNNVVFYTGHSDTFQKLLKDQYFIFGKPGRGDWFRKQIKLKINTSVQSRPIERIWDCMIQQYSLSIYIINWTNER